MKHPFYTGTAPSITNVINRKDPVCSHLNSLSRHSSTDICYHSYKAATEAALTVLRQAFHISFISFFPPMDNKVIDIWFQDALSSKHRPELDLLHTSKAAASRSIQTMSSDFLGRYIVPKRGRVKVKRKCFAQDLKELGQQHFLSLLRIWPAI